MSYIGKSPTPVPLTSEDIADGVIITADLADGAVTNLKVAADAAIAASKISGLATVATTGAYSDVTGTPTISAFGETLIDDADASTARTTLGLGTMAVETATDYVATTAIGSTVQAYDAGLAYLDGLNFTDEATFKAGVNLEIGTDVQAYDADTAKTDVAQTYTAQQTFGELKETVFTLGTSGSIALDPANGSIQVSTLTGDPTFTDSLEAGQTLILMLNGGASNTVTFPTVTWVGPEGNTAPTLTANDTLVFWKVSTTLYAANVGSYA